MSVKLPEFNESLAHSHSAPDGAFVFEAIVISLASVAGLLTNIFNLVVVPRLPGTSLASKIFYSMVFITDICGSLTAFLTLPGFFLRRWVYGETFCLIFTLVWNTYPRITSTCLFLLAIDRHIYVTRPLRYDQIVTPNRIGYFTVSVLSQSVFEGPVSVLFSSPKPTVTFDPLAGACDWLTRNDKKLSTDNIIWSCWLFVFLVTIVCLHSHIACITRRHSKSIKSRQSMAPQSSIKTVSMTYSTEHGSSSGETMTFSGTSSVNPQEKPEQPGEAFQEHVRVDCPTTTSTTLQAVVQPPAKKTVSTSHGDPHYQDAKLRNKVDPPKQVAEWKAVKLAILLSFAFFLGFLPEAVYKAIQNINQLDVYQLFIFIHLLYMNRVWWNALIFYYGRNAYRLQVSRLFRCLGNKRVDHFGDSSSQ